MNLIEKWPRAKALQVRGILERLNLCACGTNAHWKCVFAVLLDAELGPSVHRKIHHDQWYEFAAKVMTNWNLLEHGGSIGGSWLTKDGELLLEFLRDFGLEDNMPWFGGGHPGWAADYTWDNQPTVDQIDAYAAWVLMQGEDAA